MATLQERILVLLEGSPGLSDREIASALLGLDSPPQAVNIACRALASKAVVVRQARPDGRIGNYLAGPGVPPPAPPPLPAPPSKLRAEKVAGDGPEGGLSEDDLKRVLQAWLRCDGWQADVRYGHEPGIDIDAHRGRERWIIEVKGSGSLNPMRVNYFLTILGETLQRMSDPNARYSIALPDLQQFVRLWDRLPRLAKDRTTISALFVDGVGRVRLVE
jgi:hypothetical protein